MATTYEPIATNTLGSAAATVTFSSIAGTYTDLVVVTNGSASANSDFFIAFNGDTGFNYSSTQLYGTGTVAGSQRDTTYPRILIGANYANQVNILQVMNYSNSTTYKTVLSRANGPSNVVQAGVGLWRSTSAITSLVLSLNSTNTFSTGSTFTLYGIKAA